MNLGYASCCQPVGTPSSQECTCTAANVGVGLEHYVTGSTMPFEFRRTTLVGDPAGVQGPVTNTITLSTSLADRGAGDITLIATPPKVNVAGVVSLFLKQLVAGVNITFDQITDDTARINSPAVGKVFQEDSTDTLLTDSDTFVVLSTLPGDAKVLDGEEWRIEMDVLVCVPHALGSTSTNAETKWLIETAAGVFTEFDKYSSRDQITISGSQNSQPVGARSKKLTASMNAPRMRVDVRRTTVGTSDFLWELPRWGGDLITLAP